MPLSSGKWVAVRCVAVLIATLLVVEGVDARTWSVTNGKKVEADFVERQKNSVLLRKENGETVKFSIRAISKSDRQFLTKLTEEMLNSTMLPRIDWQEISAEDAVKFLSNKAVELNKGKPRIAIVLKGNKRKRVVQGGPVSGKDSGGFPSSRKEVVSYGGPFKTHGKDLLESPSDKKQVMDASGLVSEENSIKFSFGKKREVDAKRIIRRQAGRKGYTYIVLYSLSARDISLHEALRILGSISGMELKTEEGRCVLVPQKPTKKKRR